MTQETGSGKLRQFCTFRVADRLFGVDILDVKEVNATAEFTPIYHAAPEIQGYVNIRGQIHLIINLRLLLGYDKKEADETCRLILFKPAVGENFGVLVERIGDVVTVNDMQIEARTGEALSSSGPEGDGRRLADLGAGVCKLDGALIMILNPRRFLPILKSQN